MPSPIIEIRELSKRYLIGSDNRSVGLGQAMTSLFTHPIRTIRGRDREEFWALRDVSLNIEEGDVVGLIGRNGAGKSTLLKLVSRITAPTKGEIHLRGRVASLLEVGTGFHPELTGLENIYLNGAILGMTRNDIDRKMDSIIEFSDVEKFLHTPTKRYSSGMAVRLAFAVAAHLEPEILAVDEVLAVGDTAFQKKCIGKMGEMASGGRTVVFVSHNLATINSLCNKAILLVGGQVDCLGARGEVVSRYLDLLAESAKVRLGDRSDRTGNGRLRLMDCELIAPNGSGSGPFVSGGTAKFRVRYQSSAGPPLTNVHVAMAISDPSGTQITDLSNYYVEDDWGTVPPNGFFECRIDRIPLMPGRYSFNFLVRINGQIADWVLNAGQFTVEAGTFFPGGRLLEDGNGYLLIDHSWDFGGDS